MAPQVEWLYSPVSNKQRVTLYLTDIHNDHIHDFKGKMWRKGEKGKLPFCNHKLHTLHKFITTIALRFFSHWIDRYIATQSLHMTVFILSFLTAQMSADLRKQSFGLLVLINKMKYNQAFECWQLFPLSHCTRAASLQNSSSLAASKHHVFPSSSPITSASSPSCCASLHPLHFL